METGIINRAGYFVSKHAPTILTVSGIVGLGITAIFTGQATVVAHETIKKIDDWDDKTFVEKAKTVVPIYIPAITMGVATSACIIGAHTIDTKRTIAAASAYTLSSAAYKEYKSKVEEVLGSRKANDIREQVSQDRVTNSYDPAKIPVFNEMGEHLSLCYDEISGRYFMSSIERLKRIEADLQGEAISLFDNWITLNDLYDRLGLENISIGDDLGWSTINGDRLHIKFDAVIAPDNTPCIALAYDVQPRYIY